MLLCAQHGIKRIDTGYWHGRPEKCVVRKSWLGVARRGIGAMTLGGKFEPRKLPPGKLPVLLWWEMEGRVNIQAISA